MIKKSFINKLRNNRGESLAEVMVAILIIAVGLIILSSLVIASSRLVDNGSKKMEAIYNATSAMENHDASISNQQLDIISEKATKNSAAIIPVKVYKYEEDNPSVKMISYIKE